jgi:hypothetical protein
MNKKAIMENNPTCTHLSKKILFIQSSTLGISDPGRHSNTNTKKNQAMPGINFLPPGFPVLLAEGFMYM